MKRQTGRYVNGQNEKYKPIENWRRTQEFPKGIVPDSLVTLIVRITHVKIPVIRIKKGDIVTTINGTYPWSSNNIL
jgi:hypothetical protein